MVPDAQGLMQLLLLPDRLAHLGVVELEALSLRLLQGPPHFDLDLLAFPDLQRLVVRLHGQDLLPDVHPPVERDHVCHGDLLCRVRFRRSSPQDRAVHQVAVCLCPGTTGASGTQASPFPLLDPGRLALHNEQVVGDAVRLIGSRGCLEGDELLAWADPALLGRLWPPRAACLAHELVI